MGRSSRGSTQLANVELCEALWAYENVFGLEPRFPPRHLMRGSLIHEALAYHWASQLPAADRPPWFYELTLKQALDHIGQGRPSLIGLALNVVAQYQASYGPKDENWTPLWVEREFNAKLTGGGHLASAAGYSVGPDVVSAKPDLVAYDQRDGRILLVDHKTGAPKGSEFELSWQLSFYRMVLEANDVAIDGVVIQSVKTNTHGTVCAFDRIEVPMNRHMDPLILHTLKRRMKKEEEVRQRGYGEPNYGPQTCFGRWGPCWYRDLCTARDPDHQQTIISRDFKQRGQEVEQ